MGRLPHCDYFSCQYPVHGLNGGATIPWTDNPIAGCRKGLSHHAPDSLQALILRFLRFQLILQISNPLEKQHRRGIVQGRAGLHLHGDERIRVSSFQGAYPVEEIWFVVTEHTGIALRALLSEGAFSGNLVRHGPGIHPEHPRSRGMRQPACLEIFSNCPAYVLWAVSPGIVQAGDVCDGFHN